MTKVRENHTSLAMAFDEDQVYMVYKTDYIKPTLFDRTGGYGQLAIPLMMAWVHDEGVWLIGQEANNMDEKDGILVRDLLKGVSQDQSLVVKGQSLTYQSLLLIYIMALAEEIYDVNPHSIIELIHLKLPPSCADVATAIVEGLKKVSHCPVVLVTELEAGAVWAMDQSSTNDMIWVNYDRQGLHGYVLTRKALGVTIEKVLEVQALSLTTLESDISQAIDLAYRDHSELGALSTSYQHMIGQMAQTYLPHIFKRQLEGQALKITFNQVFPPFQSLLTYEQLTAITATYYKGLEQGLTYLRHTYMNDCCLFTGEGFRLPWARKLASQISGKSGYLQWDGQLNGLLSSKLKSLSVTNLNEGSGDIGIMVGHKDHPKFYRMVPSGETILGYTKIVELIVEKEDDWIQLLRRSDGDHVEVIKEQSIKKHLKHHLNRIRLTVACHGVHGIEMTVSRLTL